MLREFFLCKFQVYGFGETWILNNTEETHDDSQSLFQDELKTIQSSWTPVNGSKRDVFMYKDHWDICIYISYCKEIEILYENKQLSSDNERRALTKWRYFLSFFRTLFSLFAFLFPLPKFGKESEHHNPLLIHPPCTPLNNLIAYIRTTCWVFRLHIIDNYKNKTLAYRREWVFFPCVHPLFSMLCGGCRWGTWGGGWGFGSSQFMPVCSCPLRLMNRGSTMSLHTMK